MRRHVKSRPRAKRSMSIERSETFVILDPMQMHEHAMIGNKPLKVQWEAYLRNELLNDKQYTLVTRLLYTYPVKRKTSVVLHQTFPILEDARLADKDPGLICKRHCFRDLGNVELHFCNAFDTVHFGRVFLIGISYLAPDLLSSNCQFKLGLLTPSQTAELTLSMTNLGNPSDIYTFMVTMIVPYTGCRLCATFSPPVDTRTRMLKCGRCWKDLQFPVWYCSTECQALDYKRHRVCDGCGVMKK
jgi:hypothetical protein